MASNASCRSIDVSALVAVPDRYACMLTPGDKCSSNCQQQMAAVRPRRCCAPALLQPAAQVVACAGLRISGLAAVQTVRLHPASPHPPLALLLQLGPACWKDVAITFLRNSATELKSITDAAAQQQAL